MAERGTEFQKVDQSSLEVLTLTSRLLKMERNMNRFVERKSLVDNLFGAETNIDSEKTIKLEIKKIKSRLNPNARIDSSSKQA